MITAGATEKALSLFWDKVDKRGPEECWPWTAAVTSHGTPTLQWMGRNQTALRVVWELDRGKAVPQGRIVKRTCDNKLCVNPAHLYVLGFSPVVQQMPAGSRLADATAEMLVRFWAKVDRRGPDQCWIWSGACHPAPAIKWGDRLISALHVVYELERGEAVPQGVQVRRTCGKEWCVNPAHFKLFGGDRDVIDHVSTERPDIWDLAALAGFDLVPAGSPGRYHVVPLEVKHGSEDVSAVA